MEISISPYELVRNVAPRFGWEAVEKAFTILKHDERLDILEEAIGSAEGTIHPTVADKAGRWSAS